MSAAWPKPRPQGEPGVRQLRATTGSADPARRVRPAAARGLRYAESAYLSGLLTGAARAVERARQHQSVSVVWTGPESGVSSSRLTAAAVIDLINAARSEILLVSYATHTEPSISAALSAAVARDVAVTLLAERHAGQPVLHGSGHALPGPRRAPPALARVVAPARRGAAREDHRGRRPGRARRQREPHQPRHGVQPRMRHPHPRRPAAPCHPRPHHRPARSRALASTVRSS